MKMLVCGGRDYFDAERIFLILDILGPKLLIHGAAKGADSMALNWAVVRGVPHKGFPANWQLYGDGAGAKRNRQMLIEGKPDLVVAFPGRTGTWNMIAQAEQMGVPVLDLGDRT